MGKEVEGYGSGTDKVRCVEEYYPRSVCYS